MQNAVVCEKIKILDTSYGSILTQNYKRIYDSYHCYCAR